MQVNKITHIVSIIYRVLALFKKRQITEADINYFFQQFGVLFAAGVPLIKCFEILEKSQVNGCLSELIFSIKQNLLAGRELYMCLRQHLQYFDELTCQLVKMGEHTGKLEEILILIANEKEKKLLLQKQIKKALTYPIIISTVALLITLGLFLFVIPRFADLFAENSLQLPFLTQSIFFLSHWLTKHVYLFLIVVSLFFLPFMPLQLFHPYRKKSIYYFCKLPMLARLIHKSSLSRFARNLAIAYSAGIPITQALKLILYANANSTLTHQVILLKSKINAGLQLHQAMRLIPGFPEFMLQMIKIGEESGRMEQLLGKIADILEAEVQQFVNQFNQLLEPLIMLFQGVLIGGLVIGMYLPIFKLGNVL